MNGGIRATILWLPNRQQEDPPVVGRHGGMIVFSSAGGQNAPSYECETRTALPEAGQYESCLLYQSSPTSRSFVAYPLKSAEVFELPGINDPCELIWERNERYPDQVIRTITFEGCLTYFRVFVGENTRLVTSPHTERTRPWPVQPRPGDSSRCWINWHIPENNVPVGYAYLATEEVREDAGVFQIAGTDVIIIPRRDDLIVKAWWDDGEMHITLSPRS